MKNFLLSTVIFAILATFPILARGQGVVKSNSENYKPAEIKTPIVEEKNVVGDEFGGHGGGHHSPVHPNFPHPSPHINHPVNVHPWNKPVSPHNFPDHRPNVHNPVGPHSPFNHPHTPFDHHHWSPRVPFLPWLEIPFIGPVFGPIIEGLMGYSIFEMLFYSIADHIELIIIVIIGYMIYRHVANKNKTN